jgi:hypothetical protein
MHIRPVHIWWLGVALFAPSLLIWGAEIGPDAIFGNLDVHRMTLTQVYLPLAAALLGFTFPLVCVRFLRNASWRFTAWAFAGYLGFMLSWATIDIRHQHAQGSALEVDFHSRGIYFTWYFIPPELTKWIERGSEANKITGPNAGGPRPFPVRTSLTTRVGQFGRSVLA